jgi:hypothetical protein
LSALATVLDVFILARGLVGLHSIVINVLEDNVGNWNAKMMLVVVVVVASSGGLYDEGLRRSVPASRHHDALRKQSVRVQ